eukprot:UN24352
MKSRQIFEEQSRLIENDDSGLYYNPPLHKESFEGSSYLTENDPLEPQSPCFKNFGIIIYQFANTNSCLFKCFSYISLFILCNMAIIATFLFVCKIFGWNFIYTLGLNFAPLADWWYFAACLCFLASSSCPNAHTVSIRFLLATSAFYFLCIHYYQHKLTL